MTLSLKSLPVSKPSSSHTSIILSPLCKSTTFSSTSSKIHCPNISKAHSLISSSQHSSNSGYFRISCGYYRREEDVVQEDFSFNEAVDLFNKREYYKCHDSLEGLWVRAEEPTRTLLHGILQCAVGFHHLFNQNHKGAMMELGEGLCKLRKMNFESGPFHQFEREISAVLNFIYQTQIELAACSDDLCLAMDQSERSYQLLGGYAAGQHLYSLQKDLKGATFIVFCPQRSYASGEPQRVELPILNATEEHLLAYN